MLCVSVWLLFTLLKDYMVYLKTVLNSSYNPSDFQGVKVLLGRVI